MSYGPRRSLASRYREAVLQTPGLWSYWRLHEQSGVMVDLMAGRPLSPTGTMLRRSKGPHPVCGPYAVTLGGGSLVDTTNVIPTSSDMTFEAWIRCTIQYNQKMVIVGGRNSSLSGNPGWMFLVGGTAATYQHAWLGLVQNGNSIDCGAKSNELVGTGRWHHVVAVWDGTAGSQMLGSQMTMYRDGVNIGVTANNGGCQTAPVAQSGWSGFRVGALGGGGGEFYGQLADVAVYLAPLTAAQVLQHYNAMMGR